MRAVLPGPHQRPSRCSCLSVTLVIGGRPVLSDVSGGTVARIGVQDGAMVGPPRH
jgi:hypothetical protein